MKAEQKNITYTPEQVFGSEKIEDWTKEGHWPPPLGSTVFPIVPLSQETMAKLTKCILDTLEPKDRKLRKLLERELTASDRV